MDAERKLHGALTAFVETIDVVGGVFRGPKGLVFPVGDPDWADLGDAYLEACQALDRAPVWGRDPEAEDVETEEPDQDLSNAWAAYHAGLDR